MKEKSLILSQWESKAVLDGRKTGHIMPMKPQPEYRENASIKGHFATWFKDWNLDHPAHDIKDISKYSPFGNVAKVGSIIRGDRLKELARIWLEKTGEKVCRLGEITEQDAIAQGVERNGDSEDEWWNYRAVDFDDFPTYSALESYESLYESKKRLRGSFEMDKDIWVWVAQFKVVSTTGKPNEND